MSNIRELSFDVRRFHSNAQCKFCDEKATAVWYGTPDFYCCPKCAVEVLPKMIADSILGELLVAQILSPTDNIVDAIGANFKAAVRNRLERFL